MRNRKRSRPVVALVAAYVVALQALLLPFSVAAAGPLFAVLCSGSVSDQGPVAPAGHAAACAGCGMQCGSVAALPPPEPGIAPADRWTFTGRHAPVLVAAVAAPHRGPQIPRAPPFG
jgi:hypothetical protein